MVMLASSRRRLRALAGPDRRGIRHDLGMRLSAGPAVRSVSDSLSRGAGFVLKAGGSAQQSLVRDGLTFKCPRLRASGPGMAS
jgi:hypothetical protein